MAQLDKLILNLIREQKLMCSGVARVKTDLGHKMVSCPNKAIGYRWRQEKISSVTVPAIIAWCPDHEVDLQGHDTINVIIDAPLQQRAPARPDPPLACPHITAVRKALQEQHVSLVSETEISMVCRVCDNGGMALIG
jgi:hypothetical protein